MPTQLLTITQIYYLSIKGKRDHKVQRGIEHDQYKIQGPAVLIHLWKAGEKRMDTEPVQRGKRLLPHRSGGNRDCDNGGYPVYGDEK